MRGKNHFPLARRAVVDQVLVFLDARLTTIKVGCYPILRLRETFPKIDGDENTDLKIPIPLGTE